MGMAGNEDTDGRGRSLSAMSVGALEQMLAEQVVLARRRTPKEDQDQTKHVRDLRNLASAARMITLAVTCLLRAQGVLQKIVGDTRRDEARVHPARPVPMENEGMNDDEFGPRPDGPDASGDTPEVLERKRAFLYRELETIIRGGGIPGNAERSDAHECGDLSLEPDGASASG